MEKSEIDAYVQARETGAHLVLPNGKAHALRGKVQFALQIGKAQLCWGLGGLCYG